MIGERLCARLRIVNHDCEDRSRLSFVDKTGSGFPVWIHSDYCRAEVKVLTGVIAPHHGPGYSGGRKSLIPGIAGLETIRRFHSFPINPYGPAMGLMAGNPMHECAVEGARMAGVDFIVNVVTNSAGEVVQAVAGDLVAAHEAGVETCAAHWTLDLPQRYDVVIVAPGGYPRDINLHQSQKAMSVAETVVAEGGTIVLIAECREGVGKFGPWLVEAASPRAVIERFEREGFTGSSSFKAFYCARALDKHTVIVACSGIEREELQQMFFVPAASPQSAVDAALAAAGPQASVLVLPYAVHAVPRVGGA
jgi:nickel-dependent lactate racemase